MKSYKLPTRVRVNEAEQRAAAEACTQEACPCKRWLEEKEDACIAAWHAFKAMGVPVRVKSRGVFLVDVLDRFGRWRVVYFYPRSGKWRPEGAVKTYMSGGAVQFMDTWARHNHT